MLFAIRTVRVAQWCENTVNIRGSVSLVAQLPRRQRCVRAFVCVSAESVLRGERLLGQRFHGYIRTDR